MVQYEAPKVTLPETGKEDPRVGHFLTTCPVNPPTPRAVIIGCPTEAKLRGERAGAAEGPDAIREALYRMTLSTKRHEPFRDLLLASEDRGNLVLSGNIEEDQEMLGDVVAELLLQKAIPIILGGGQTVSYGHFLGYVKAKKKCNILALDSRLDVQELIDGHGHGGSAFRQVISHPSNTCQLCEIAGLLPHATSKAHVDFLERHHGTVTWRSELTESRIDELYGPAQYPLMCSFDLGGVDQAQAPGVSRPMVNGMGIDLWLYAARRAGSMMQVRSLDLVELSPSNDIDKRTARLAALTVWTFLKGMVRRLPRHH